MTDELTQKNAAAVEQDKQVQASETKASEAHTEAAEEHTKITEEARERSDA